eukprot:7246088-Prymnesium_polylepis.1
MLGRRSGQCLVGCSIRLCVLPCEEGANCTAGGAVSAAAEEVRWQVAWPWHPCRLRQPVLKQEAYMLVSLLQIVMLVYLQLLHVRGTKQANPGRSSRRRLCVPPLAPLRRLALFVCALVYTISAMATTGVPILDDAWRWVALLFCTLPLLLSATVLTGWPSPAACALFVILQVRPRAATPLCAPYRPPPARSRPSDRPRPRPPAAPRLAVPVAAVVLSDAALHPRPRRLHPRARAPAASRRAHAAPHRDQPRAPPPARQADAGVGRLPPVLGGAL